MRWRKSYVDGTFGDKTVILTTGVIDRPERVVLLFHGVHSNANSEPGNKYARIGLALAECGLLPVLTETSRRVRNRSDYQDNPGGWIKDAFAGKTFDNELHDCANALFAVQKQYPALPITLWGFSLGGINALLIASGYVKEVCPSHVDSLIMCGSGDAVFPENKDMFKLPILSTMTGSLDDLTRAASKLNLKWARVFRGTQDTTFPEDACRHLFSSMSVEDKQYYEIKDSDHSFRFLNGQPSMKPLWEVYRCLPQLFPEGTF